LSLGKSEKERRADSSCRLRRADPASFKSILFAAYPLFLPIYLAEFVKDEKRVTTVAFAAADRAVRALSPSSSLAPLTPLPSLFYPLSNPSKQAFAIYPTFRSPSPEWLPNGDAVELSIGGSPVDFHHVPKPDALKTIKPKLDEWLETIKEEGEPGSMRSVVDPVGIGGMEAVEKNERVMRYSDFAS
jgi:hypothetical protein